MGTISDTSAVIRVVVGPDGRKLGRRASGAKRRVSVFTSCTVKVHHEVLTFHSCIQLPSSSSSSNSSFTDLGIFATPYPDRCNCGGYRVRLLGRQNRADRPYSVVYRVRVCCAAASKLH